MIFSVTFKYIDENAKIMVQFNSIPPIPQKPWLWMARMETLKVDGVCI